MDVKKVVINSI